MNPDMDFDGSSGIPIIWINFWVIGVYDEHIWIMNEIALMPVPLMRI